MGKGAYKRTDPNQTPNTIDIIYGSQAVGDKLHCREGNNPDRQLRSLSMGLVTKDVTLHRQLGGWLRSSHPLKSA